MDAIPQKWIRAYRAPADRERNENRCLKTDNRSAKCSLRLYRSTCLPEWLLNMFGTDILERKTSRNLLRPDTGHTSTLHTTPLQKKNKIDTEHRVCGLRVHHNCHKKIGIVEFFRTGSEPALAPLPPLIYIYIYIPPPKKEKKQEWCRQLCFCTPTAPQVPQKIWHSGVLQNKAGTNPLWSNHTATLHTTTHQKKGKNKIDTEHHVFGIRVHHNCRNKKMVAWVLVAWAMIF